MSDLHPYRSVLYMPGSNPRALEKARTLAADALILDLEDAVAPGEKARGRALVCEAIQTGGFGPRKLIVRINGLDTEWGAADLEAAIAVRPDGILVPKVSSRATLSDVAGRMAHPVPLWAMMETPLGVLNAAEIASTPGLAGFVLGTNDLVKDLGAEHTADRTPLVTGLGLCLLAARAHGLICVDGVYNAYKDTDGLRAACEQGRQMGFDGKTLIHPAQLEIANEVFAPSAADIDLARRQIEAYEAAIAAGEAVAVVDGRIVENLHVETARKTLAHADAIVRLAQN